jgi:hypothetical protein
MQYFGGSVVAAIARVRRRLSCNRKGEDMIASTRRLAAVAVALSLCVASGQVFGAGIGDKAALQAAMQQHIDRNLIDGAYLYMDEKAGEVRPLYPQKAHPVILRMGDYYVLCSDFRDADNDPVNIDFYMAQSGDGYVVFHQSMDNDKLIHRLMNEGKAEPLN